ncbi:MAG: hypothetical protein MI919_31945 [Holophagales bacterium]|nr:hypothetical protein [Holophagales bacterium]
MTDYKPYSPALLPRQIRALYWLKEETRIPMTKHAQRAVDLYLEMIEEARAEEAEGDCSGGEEEGPES